MSRFELDISQFSDLVQQFSDNSGKLGDSINEVLKSNGAEIIKGNIIDLLPVSSKEWNGKVGHAKYSQPFTQEFGDLSVTVKTVYDYHYLYFPDDGSDTVKHEGNQQFMRRGAEMSVEEISKQITQRYLERIS